MNVIETDPLEQLRTMVLLRCGQSCNKTRCGDRSFAHDHHIWAADYAEWLVRIALLGGWDGSVARLMANHPPENLERIRAVSRTALAHPA